MALFPGLQKRSLDGQTDGARLFSTQARSSTGLARVDSGVKLLVEIADQRHFGFPVRRGQLEQIYNLPIHSRMNREQFHGSN